MRHSRPAGVTTSVEKLRGQKLPIGALPREAVARPDALIERSALQAPHEQLPEDLARPGDVSNAAGVGDQVKRELRKSLII